MAMKVKTVYSMHGKQFESPMVLMHSCLLMVDIQHSFTPPPPCFYCANKNIQE